MRTLCVLGVVVVLLLVFQVGRLVGAELIARVNLTLDRLYP